MSWDEALGEIAARLGEIAAGPAPATILNAHYTGTCALLGTAFPQRFFHRLGATEVDPDTICNKAGHEALAYLYGSSGEGFDPRDGARVELHPGLGREPVGLGAAPARALASRGPRRGGRRRSGPDADGGGGRPAPAAVSGLATRRSHLRSPMSSSATASLDRGFVDAHTAGFDELEPLLAPCTPDGGRRSTGVPAAAIEQAARAYGRGPRCSGSARASSASRAAATRCAPWRCCPL